MTARLILGLLLLPLAAGLGVTLAQAEPWAALALPGLGRAVLVSLLPGLGATGIALGLTALVIAFPPPGARLLRGLLPPFLALPHAAFALGLAFLLAPSGPLFRLAAPLAGWTDPPDLQTTGTALALTLGLVLKETPFLLFLALAARTPQIARMGTVAATLGQGRALAFALVEWPLLYARLRLPVRAVLAYGMTTVDMGAILGPGLPASLSVEVTRAATRADLGGEGLAAGLALGQLGLVLAALALWRGLEALGRKLSQGLIARGVRGRGLDGAARGLSALAGAALIVLPLAALATLALWTLVARWPFPTLVPPLTLQPLGAALPDLWPLALTTAALAAGATLCALALTLAALQARPSRLEALIWLPLILPQVAFLPGLARALIPTGLGPWPATLAAHLVFVLPYTWLVLAGPFRAWNPRLGEVAATLGARPVQVLLRLRLPMLAPSLAAAAAIGIAVSTGQYLATLLIAGGRLPTLTTEAVALATGPDRARIAALGLAQALLPLVAFALAARVKPFPSGPRPLRQGP